MAFANVGEQIREQREPVLAPWEINPYQLVNWWEMQQFSAFAFYVAGYSLEALFIDCVLNPPGAGGDDHISLAVLHQPLDERTRNRAITALPKIETEFRNIGMDITADTILETVQRIEADSSVTFDWLKSQISAIQKLIQKEMKGKFFLYISPERAKFWPKKSQPNIFGQDVATAFPSATFDIAQAGIALSTHLSTACVFHLMRAMEIILSILGAKFDVSLTHTNWAPAIEEIEKKIRNMHKESPWKALPDCKGQQEFYAQAASYFGVLKDAWRNYTMHARSKYTEDEAEGIFNNVKGFTKKLAERLSENETENV